MIVQTYLIFLSSQFTIKPLDKKKEVFKFYSSQLRVNKLVSCFCKCVSVIAYQNSCSCHLYMLDITVVYREPRPVHEEEEGGKWPYASTTQAITALGAKHTVKEVTISYLYRVLLLSSLLFSSLVFSSLLFSMEVKMMTLHHYIPCHNYEIKS